MNPKNESPADITLEKSPSGTWNVSGAPRRAFAAWQRFWLVAGLLYMMMLTGGFYLVMPDQERIDRRMVQAVMEEVHRYDGMAFAGESPREIYLAARSAGYDAWITAVRSRYRIGNEGNSGFDKIQKNYQESVSSLPVKRAIGIVLCIIAWALPMSVLYAIGLLSERLKRGIRVVRG
jgi:hypothetical protein